MVFQPMQACGGQGPVGRNGFLCPLLDVERGEFEDVWLYFSDRSAKHFLSGKASGTEAAETSHGSFIAS